MHFLDTHILLYSISRDPAEAIKRERAIALLDRDGGALSVQVLQEFYVNVTRKIPRPLSKESARLVVSSYAVWCIDTTPGEMSNAFQIEDASKIGFWDALIVASALKNGATRILSEDLNPGQMIAGIRIENPFAM